MRNTSRPNHTSRLNHRRSLATVLLILSVVAGAAPARAQTSSSPSLIPSIPSIPLPVNPFTPAPTLHEGAVPTIQGQARPPEDYWIVNLRNCPQFSQRKSPGCCRQFLHHTPDGCLRVSSHAEFLATLAPGTPVCMMIHGSYLEWKGAKVDAKNTFRWVRGAAPHLPLHFAYITWPGDPKFPPFDICILGRQSARNGFHLANLIRTIPAHHPISLIGHSHGTRMALSTLHLLNGGEVQGHQISRGCCSPHRLRVILAAAAVDHHWLNPGERYGNALPLTECLLNLRTRRDRALAFYPLRKPFSAASLGRKGFTRRDISKMGPLAPRVTEIDVTPLVGNHHFWQFYSKDPGLAQMVMPYIYFPEPTATLTTQTRESR